MSRLKVDRIETTNAEALKIAPGVAIQNSTFTDRVIINGNGNGHLSVTCPIRVGTTMVSVTAGQIGQVLTSQGGDVSPQWKSVAQLPLYNEFPIGGIIMWSGSLYTIPSGYKLCNGDTYNNGALKTPDLRDRFIIGVSNTYPLNSTGGSKDAVVVAHTHTTSTVSLRGSFDMGAGDTVEPATGVFSAEIHANTRPGLDYNSGRQQTTTLNADHTHSINSEGVAGTNANLPPYYALYYIMKIS